MLKKIMLSVCIGLSLLCIAGCGKNKKDEKKELSVYTYSEFDETLKDSMISNIKKYDGNIYFLAEKYPDIPEGFLDEQDKLDEESPDNIEELTDQLYEKYNSIIHAGIWKYNPESGEKSVVYEKEYYINDNISEYFINDDGSLMIIFKELNPAADKGSEMYTVSVKQVTADGTELSSQSLKEYTGYDEYGAADITFDQKGNIYGEVPSDDYRISCIFKMDSEKKLIGEIDCGNEDVVDIITDDNGNMLIKSNTAEGNKYMAADFENGKFKPLEQFTNTMSEEEDEDNKAEESTEGHEYKFFGCAGENNFLIGDNVYMYDYNMSDNTITPLLKWLDLGIIESSVVEVIPIDDERFLCSITENDNGDRDIVIFEKSNVNDSEKTTLTLAGLYNNDDIRKKITAFNRENAQYKIEYKTYDDKEDPYYALNLDITAGRVPDIIDMSDINKDIFISAGVLCDLTPFMEKDDVLGLDYFVDGLADCTAVDGRQYYLSDSFIIHTIAGKASSLKEYKDNWTMDSFMQYCNSKAGKAVFDIGDKHSVFETLLIYNVNAYINWNTGEVFFDGEEFRKFMEFCNSLPDEEDVDIIRDEDGALRAGDVLFTETGIYSLSEMSMKERTAGEVAYIGYPGSTGGVSYIVLGNALAIGASSEYKEAAWEFIKNVITSSKYDEDMNGFPASKAEFEKMVRRCTATEEYTDENGQTVKPIDDEYTAYDGNVYDIGPATEKEVSELRNIIKHSIVTVLDNDDDGYKIIAEEAEKYFSGEKSLDETVSVIQDRMKKYVNENR